MKARFRKEDPFKHGFDLDYPPYSYRQDDNSVGGFDVELCQAVCEYMGWGYEAVPFNWDAKDAELNAQSCDCIWSGFTKEGREDQYTWGITLMKCCRIPRLIWPLLSVTSRSMKPILLLTMI